MTYRRRISGIELRGTSAAKRRAGASPAASLAERRGRPSTDIILYNLPRKTSLLHTLVSVFYRFLRALSFFLLGAVKTRCQIYFFKTLARMDMRSSSATAHFTLSTFTEHLIRWTLRHFCRTHLSLLCLGHIFLSSFSCFK